MTLVLRIENAERLDPGMSSVFRVTQGGASVGRRTTMDWVLPDPDRLISGHHFDIRFRDGVYYLSDLSTNGTFIGGTRQRLTGEYPLRGGERLLVGHYSIAVDLEAPPPEPPRAPASSSLPGLRRPSFSHLPDDSGLRRPRVAQGSGGRLQVPSLASSGAADPAHRPFPTAGDRGPVQHHDNPTDRDRRPVAPAAPVGGGMPSPRDRTQAMPSPPRSIPPVPAARPAHAADQTVFAAAPARPDPRGGPASDGVPDPWAVPADSAGSAAPETTSARDDRAALLAAFCAAAGLPPDTIDPESAEDFMVVLGESHRIIADDLMHMLKQRGTMKVFMLGAQQTMLGATDNNPLKFMSDRTQALELLFGPPRDGFLSAPEAFAAALGEIRSHHEALLEAMQAALGEVFDGLSPEEIRDAARDRGPEALWNAYRERWYAKSKQGEFGMLDAYLSALERTYAEAMLRHHAP